MGREPESPKTPAWSLAAVAASAAIGLALMADQAYKLSATYDEVTYLRVAAQWWRTGEQETITRLGSPLTFWKLQQAPTLWALDHLGHRSWVDDPIAHQSDLLPIIRIGGLWVWLVALMITAHWARRLYGPRAMALASAIFALGPNLLAHGSLSTMEMPVLAATSGMLLGFWSYLTSGNRRAFWGTAALGGLALSCKFTAVLIPPILALAWGLDLWMAGRGEGKTRLARAVATLRTLIPGTLGFLVALTLANVLITGFATLPLSANDGSHPLLERRLSPEFQVWAGRIFETRLPADWVGFATQALHQRHGGPSYLLGERRTTGWIYYYPVTLAVKLPLAFWFLAAIRSAAGARVPRKPGDRAWFLPLVVAAFLLAAMLGSKRNYGVRYLLPVAAPGIVWVSGLAECGRRARWSAALGVAGMAASIALIHPHELSYFNLAAGGPIGGRRILSDSNLDWGQGARSLAKLQAEHPEFLDLTVYYFGDTDPAYYGVRGTRVIFDANRTPPGLPAELDPKTKFLAVSASLQWGPWGPPGYFRRLNPIAPECYTVDGTIAIYRASDLLASGEY